MDKNNKRGEKLKTCKDCCGYKEKMHKTGFGNYPCECTINKIGVNPDSDKCDKYNGEPDTIFIIDKGVNGSDLFE